MKLNLKSIRYVMESVAGSFLDICLEFLQRTQKSDGSNKPATHGTRSPIPALSTPKKMKLEVGDLVRVRGKEWISDTIGIVTEVKCLVHRPSNVEYTVVTAIIENKSYTFSDEDFELVKRIYDEK